MLQPLFRNQATILGTLDPFVSKFSTDTSSFIIPAENLGITIDAEKPVREASKPGLGTLGHNKSMRTADITFTLPLKQKSSATAESSIGRLLRACGMDVWYKSAPVWISGSPNKDVTLRSNGSALNSAILANAFNAGEISLGMLSLKRELLTTDRVFAYGNTHRTGNSLPKSHILSFTCSDPSCTFTLVQTALVTPYSIVNNIGDYDIVANTKYVITPSTVPAAGSVVNMNIFGVITSYTVLVADNTIAKLCESLAGANSTCCADVVYSSTDVIVYPADFLVATGDAHIPSFVSAAGVYDSHIYQPCDNTGSQADLPDISHTVFFPDGSNASTSTYIYYVNNNLNLDRATFTLNYNGIYYSITDCVGTFSIEATAGNTPKITFSFKGLYDEAASSITIPAYLTELLDGNLPVSENGNITFADYGDEIIIEKFGFDIANEIVKRISANSSDGIVNFIRASRSPKITIDPETVPVWVFDPIAKQKSNDLYPYFMRVCDNDSYNGEIWFFAPNTQITSAGFGERNKIATTPLELTVTEQGVSTLDSEFYFIFT